MFICLEGRIYGKSESETREELVGLAKKILGPGALDKRGVTDWLLGADGEFIIFAFDKETGVLAVLNDTLGRLPLFYHKSKGKLMLSRSIRFLADMTGEVKFDRMAIALYLLFRHTLGEKTLFESINRIRPSTLLKINTRNSSVKLDVIHEYNFDEKGHSGNTVKQNGLKLASLFTQSCKDRLGKGGKNIVSLSGGLDSRGIAACLKKNNLPFSAVTNHYHLNDPSWLDAQGAEKIAQTLDVDWELIRLKPPNGGNFLELLKLTDGRAYLGFTHLIPYLKTILGAHGSGVTCFSGVGGENLRPLKPLRSFKGHDDLARYIVSRIGIIPLDSVEKLTGLGRESILAEISGQLMKYPEKDLGLKYVHYVIYEFAFHRVFYGEDLNRHFFWTVSPYYGIHFFKYYMNCPDEQKDRYQLFRELLTVFSPEIAAIPNVQFRESITSNKFKVKQLISWLLRPIPLPVKGKIKRLLKGRTPTATNEHRRLRECLKEQVDSCNSVQKYLAVPEVEHFSGRCNYQQLTTLLTVTAIIEDFTCEDSTFQRYRDSTFP